MARSALVAVHLGYAEYSIIPKASYGDYSEYKSSLINALVDSKTAVVFLYRNDKLPKQLRGLVNAVKDPLGEVDTKELVSLLRGKNITEVTIGGEFLWWCGPDGKQLVRNLARYKEELPEGRRELFQQVLDRTQVLDAARFSKQVGLDVEDFTEKVFRTGDVVNMGCVGYMQEELSGKFNEVKIDRRLCYPRAEPPEPTRLDFLQR